jgi:hypothetical protein
MFTRIKNRIQYCIVEAIDSGVDPLTFVLPMISIIDALSK